MLRAQVRLVKYNLDYKGHQAATQKALSELLDACAREFLKATFAKIPVWSGMARASTLPMARYLKMSLTVTPKAGAPNRVNLGQSQGAFDFQYGPKVYRMTFVSNVFHYFLMDNYALPQNYGQPWQSTTYGVDAFINKIETDGQDILPSIILFTRATPIRIG